jgi:hypothetical protein
MRWILNGFSNEDVLLLSGIFAVKLASGNVCHLCCISNVWPSEEFVLVTHCLISHLKNSLFCCDFKLHFLIKSSKWTLLREFIDNSNCIQKSIPWTCLWEICDFWGSVKQCKIFIVYVCAILYLYNPLIKI